MVQKIKMGRGETARSTPGSGPGLTIAKKIAELHRGNATIEAHQGRGTIAKIVLPKE